MNMEKIPRVRFRDCDFDEYGEITGEEFAPFPYFWHGALASNAEIMAMHINTI